MRRILYVVLVIAIGAALELVLSWWFGVALAGLLVGVLLKRESAGMLFAIGLLGGALFWGGHAAYINNQNAGLLAARVGGAFGGLSAMSMVGSAALLGGLYAGIGALVGHYGRGLISGDSVGKITSSVD